MPQAGFFNLFTFRDLTQRLLVFVHWRRYGTYLSGGKPSWLCVKNENQKKDTGQTETFHKPTSAKRTFYSLNLCEEQ